MLLKRRNKTKRGPIHGGINNKPLTRMIIFDKEDISNLLHVRSLNYPTGQRNGKSGFVLNSEYVTSSLINMKFLIK